jgi:phytoene synthase
MSQHDRQMSLPALSENERHGLHAHAAQPPSDDDSRAVAAALVQRSGTSFYWAMRLLAPERRAAMYAIYAFCRAVDDVADEAGTRDEKHAQIAEWRLEIDRLYTGAPRTAIGRQLALAARRFDLQREDFMAVLDGMQMDIDGPIQAPSMEMLDLYCQRVACAVGLLSARAFGAPGEEGRRVAQALGRALQLTNILRDLAEDGRIGRLYLPAELLAKHGVVEQEPDAVLRHPGLPEVCDEMAEMARYYFAKAAAAMKECPRASMRPARVMMETYRRVLDKLIVRGWARLDEPVSLAMPLKLFIALRHGLI